MKTIALYILNGYQRWISPLLGPRCRFHPTCSDYAKQAIEDKNIFFALVLILKRLLKCHPFHEGGFDPVERQP